jgi:hypothetical protein
MNTAMFPHLFITYYLIPQLLEREKFSALICHGGRDMGFNDYFARTMSLEYKGKIDAMSVIDREEDDPKIAKKALANLGTFKQTFSNPVDEMKHWMKMENLFRLFK